MVDTFLSATLPVNNDHHNHHHHHAGDACDDGDDHPLLLWSPGEGYAEGKRGPSWPKSHAGGASAASRYRLTTKQGLQGLRFASRHAGRMPGCHTSAGVFGDVMYATDANHGAYRVRRFAPATKNGRRVKVNAGGRFQRILPRKSAKWLPWPMAGEGCELNSHPSHQKVRRFGTFVRREISPTRCSGRVSS